MFAVSMRLMPAARAWSRMACDVASWSVSPIVRVPRPSRLTDRPERPTCVYSKAVPLRACLLVRARADGRRVMGCVDRSAPRRRGRGRQLGRVALAVLDDRGVLGVSRALAGPGEG